MKAIIELRQEVRTQITQGNTQEALEILQNARGRITPVTMMELDLLSNRYFTLQSLLRMNTITYEESNTERSKINASILKIINEKIIDDEEYSIFTKKYEELILQSANNYKSISREDHVAIRIRKKYKIVKFIAEKFNEYPELIEKLKDSKDQAIIGGIAYKIKMNPKIDDLTTLKNITYNCKSNYSKGQIVNALGEIIYTGELRFGDDIEIRAILDLIDSQEDLPLSKNVERVIMALEHLLAVKR